MIDTALNARFDVKVVANPETGCHEWTAAVTGPGRHKYGVFGIAGKNVKAHRFSYERAKGPIPEGMHLDHLCRNTKCVNPDHLEAVEPKENHRRAHWKFKTHCKRGHELTPDNVYRKPKDGNRQCRKCRGISNNRHYARHNRPQTYEAGLLSALG